MRRRTATLLALGLAGAAAGGAWLATALMGGPWGMVPGGRLRGPATPCNGIRWEAFAEAREVEVEVRPERPRSVTTWSVVHGGALYLPADFLTPWKRWPHQVEADERIRLRVGDGIFECRAERVRDEAVIEALRAAAAAKYELAPDGRAARAQVWWFRVAPR